jgi:LuxR family transcriptional regulator, maltose regulon positive regulatory protein
VVLRLAQDDPHAAVAALAPVLDGDPPVLPWIGLAHAFLLEAIARDALGDRAAAGRALERALDLAEPDGALSLFLLHPAPVLLEHHARHGTAHAALIAEIQTLLAGNRSAPPPGSHAGWARSRGTDEQLTDSETRVLRYLPTHLTAHEIASELCVSVNTVSAHRRHLYAKLGVHSRRGGGPRPRHWPARALRTKGLRRNHKRTPEDTETGRTGADAGMADRLITSAAGRV